MANETFDNISKKAAEAANLAKKQAADISSQVKSDYGAEMSADMAQKGAFGFSFYLYAILAFSCFILGSVQSLLLLAAWVLLAEKNHKVAKMILSTLILYLGIQVAWSCWSVILDLFTTSIPIAFLTRPLNWINKILRILYKLAVICIGLWGILKAKRGNYFKIKLIEELF